MDLKGSLVVFCNPLLDVSATVEAELLEKYGLKANDAILADPEKHQGLFQELETNHQVSYSAGGAGQNSARAAQFLLPDGATVYIGCVGGDERGRRLKEIAQADGLRTEYMVEAGGKETGIAAVLVTGHNRSMVAQLGAANHYRLEHLLALEESLEACLPRARIIYITGFFLTVSPETIQHLAEDAHRDPAKRLAMNLSAPFLAHAFKEPMLAALPYVDVLVGNEAEALAFSEANSLGLTEPAEIGAKLVQWKRAGPAPRTVIITQGAHPTLLFYRGSTEPIEFPVKPIPAEEIVDTNGAGDAFVGGLLAVLVRGGPVDEAIQSGHRLAAHIIRQSANPSWKGFKLE